MRRIVPMAIVSLALAVTPLAAATRVLGADGTWRTGAIDGDLVLSTRVRSDLPGRHFLQAIYMLVPGGQVTRIDGEGVHWVGSPRGYATASAQRELPSDRGLMDTLGSLRVLSPVYTPADSSYWLQYIQAPLGDDSLTSVAPIAGMLRWTDAIAHFDPDLVLTGGREEVRMPVRTIAAPSTATPAVAGGSATVSGLSVGPAWCRLLGVTATATGRRQPDASDFRADPGQTLAVDGGPETVWRFRCALDAPHGVGFDLQSLLQQFVVHDERGRLFTLFYKDSHGYEGTGGAFGGYVTFLARGPADAKRLVFSYHGVPTTMDVR